APAYNEQEVLGEFHRRVTEVLTSIGCAYEIVLVNDGSRDATLQIMHLLRDRDPHVAVIDLSRNFGKEIALSAGLDHTKG
ncbi:glycosyltransferase, partial [Acinetobacter baumannii]|uniref:glycosyltransferase n=1 Tax=Acinetobacter baumannii TaxID=470 RepID=UPI00285A4D5C